MKNPSLRLEEWPLEDRNAWESAIALGGFLGDVGRASHWRLATRRTNIHHYGRFLAFLTSHGLLSDRTLASRCTPETVASYIEQLRHTVAEKTVASSLIGLTVMMKAMKPDHDWKWLSDWANRWKRNARPSRAKASRILPIEHIYGVAVRELGRLEVVGFTDKRSLPAFRNTLMIALVAACPIRRKNLAALSLDRTVTVRNGTWRIQVPGEESKNGMPLEFELPSNLVPFLLTYLDVVRPRLLGNSVSDRLWINWFGEEMTGHAVYLRFVKATKRLFGKALCPHLMRDCAATSLSMLSSAHAIAASGLLGHKQMCSTESYVHARQLDAGRKVNAILLSKTKSNRSSGRAATPLQTD